MVSTVAALAAALVSTVAAVTATLVSTVAALAAALVSIIAALAAALVSVIAASRVTCGLRYLGLLPLRLRRTLLSRLGCGRGGGSLSRLRLAGGGRRRLLLRLASGVGGLRNRSATSGRDVGRLREVLDLETLVGDLHVVDEDVGGVGRASDLLVVAPGLDRLLGAVSTRLVEGHRGDHLRREAHELGGLVVRRRSSLGGNRAIHLGGHLVRTAVRTGDDLLEGVGRVRHDVLFELPMTSGVRLVTVRAIGVLQGSHDVGVTPDALRGEGGVGRGDIDRVRRGRPEDVLDESPLLRGLQPLGLLRVAGAVRHLRRDPLLDVVGIHELLIELKVGSVERLLRGLGQAGPLQ